MPTGLFVPVSRGALEWDGLRIADSFVVNFRDRSKRSAKLLPQANSPLALNGTKPRSTEPEHLAIPTVSHWAAVDHQRVDSH